MEKAILIIRSYLAQSIDWNELRSLVKEEKKKGNPIAMMIQHLKLDSNEVRGWLVILLFVLSVVVLVFLY